MEGDWEGRREKALDGWEDDGECEGGGGREGELDGQ